jgi:hypothetical protein
VEEVAQPQRGIEGMPEAEGRRMMNDHHEDADPAPLIEYG